MGLLKKIDALKKESQNKSETIRILNLWLERKIDNPEFIKDYLCSIKRNIKSVAIYGSGLYSELFIKDILKTDISVKCIFAADWAINTYGIPFCAVKEFDSKKAEADVIINFTGDQLVSETEVISIFDILYNKSGENN